MDVSLVFLVMLRDFFSIFFYLFVLLFIIFDLEITFLFTWSMFFDYFWVQYDSTLCPDLSFIDTMVCMLKSLSTRAWILGSSVVGTWGFKKTADIYGADSNNVARETLDGVLINNNLKTLDDKCPDNPKPNHSDKTLTGIDNNGAGVRLIASPGFFADRVLENLEKKTRHPKMSIGVIIRVG